MLAAHNIIYLMTYFHSGYESCQLRFFLREFYRVILF